MNIIITDIESNEIHTLSITCPYSGMEWIETLVHSATDDPFTYSEELKAYLCDKETFEWWEKVTNELEAVHYRIHELKEKFGHEEVHDIIADFGSVDLESEAAYWNLELDTVFGEVTQ